MARCPERVHSFLDYDTEIRTVIYSTNAIESLDSRYRRAIRVCGSFPNRAGHMPGSETAKPKKWRLHYESDVFIRRVFGRGSGWRRPPTVTVLADIASWAVGVHSGRKTGRAATRLEWK